MFIRFSSKSKLGNLLPSSKKTYSLHEADEKMKELDRVFSESGKLVQMTLELTVKKKNDGFDAAFVAGNGEDTNLMLLLEQTINSFDILSAQEKQKWNQEIERAYYDEEILPQEAIAEQSEPLKNKKQKKQKKKGISSNKDHARDSFFLKLKQVPFPRLPYIPKKVVAIGVVGICLVFCIIIGGQKVYQKLNETPSYETLMEKKSYEEAAKNYPKKRRLIEQCLYDQAIEAKDYSSKEALRNYQKVYPSSFGAFDLAILNHNYEKALRIYEKEKKPFSDSDDRQVLAGYCYLKVAKRTQANKLAEELKSVELEKYVATYDQYKAQINELDNQLDELKKDPIKNRDTIEKTMNELFDVKEKLENL